MSARNLRKQGLRVLVSLVLFGIIMTDGSAQDDDTIYLPIITSGTAPIRTLDGDDAAPATAAIPALAFLFREDDYTENHPQLGGLMVSFNTIFVVFTLETTVGEANAVLSQLDAEIVGGLPGVPHQVEGVLLLRLPTTSHAEMIGAIETLRSHPTVKIAIQDSLLESPATVDRTADGLAAQSIPNPNGGIPVGWTWELTPAGDNWGLELIRVPQMWNLNHAVAKDGGSTVTGIHDSGFSTIHPDLSYLQNLSPLTWKSHGTHVAGIVGAVHNNGLGIDGVNPYARLVVNRYGFSLGWSIFEFLKARPDLKVVNVSLGHNWYRKSPPINPNTNPAAQILVSAQGNVLVQMLAALRLLGKELPLIVTIAGNDSGPPLGLVEAQWNSPFTYAALVLGEESIVVVEAVQTMTGAAGGAARAPFSNIKHATAHNAAVSALGVAIMSTDFPTLYNTKNGTSQAAPHVTGLVGYLLSIDPSLSHAQLRRLLLDNAVPVGGGASGRIDAFASALDIDGIRGNSNILRKLVDVDDGSLDGNQRVLCNGCTDFLDEDVDADGGRGDGRVDMADFRRWRDWLLQVENSADLKHDGTATHPKKDVNGNSVVEAPARENIYPQGDFNGDGILDRTTTGYVPGYIAAQATDLDVLIAVFSDTHYLSTTLPSLIDSADLEVDASDCLAQPGVTEVRTWLSTAITPTVVEGRIHTAAEPRHIFTAAVDPNGYTVKVSALDSTETVIGLAGESFPFDLGSDAFYEPKCGYITLDPEVVKVSLEVTESAQETVRLISHRLEANYAFVNSMDHVEPSPEKGTVQRDTEENIALTFTCPDEPGHFVDVLELSFTNDQGQAIVSAVPQRIEIDLTCLPQGGTPPPDWIEIRTQLHRTGTRLDRPTDHPVSRGESYTSDELAGTAFYTVTELIDGEIQETGRALAALGFSDVTMHNVSSGVFTYTTFSNEEHSRSASASVSYAASFSFTETVVTFLGTIDSDYIESEKYKINFGGIRDGAGGLTEFEFELKKDATIEASFSCDGQFQPAHGSTSGISLRRSGNCCVYVFHQNAAGCTVSGPIRRGRYLFNALTGLSYGHVAPDEHAASLTASYEIVISVEP